MDDRPTVTEIITAMKESAKLGDLLIAAEGLTGNRYAISMFKLSSPQEPL